MNSNDLLEQRLGNDKIGNGIVSVASETKINNLDYDGIPKYKLTNNKSATANMSTLVDIANSKEY